MSYYAAVRDTSVLFVVYLEDDSLAGSFELEEAGDFLAQISAEDAAAFNENRSATYADGSLVISYDQSYDDPLILEKHLAAKAVNYDALVYVDGFYSSDLRDIVEKIVYVCKYKIDAGLDTTGTYQNRLNLINSVSNWVRSIKSYTYEKGREIDQCTTVAEVQAVTWDFSTFDVGDPGVTLVEVDL